MNYSMNMGVPACPSTSYSQVPQIVCYRHCCPINIFSKSIPERCPICRIPIENFIMEPFCIPYPYTNAKDTPTSLVIKPAQGDFLETYAVNDELHIGIVDTKGIVYEYDRHGLIINACAQWSNCIAIYLVPESWNDHWDRTLEKLLIDHKWKAENYNEQTMNCFSFVVEFINNLNYPGFQVISKEDLCQRLLIAKMNEAVKYNTLYKTLECIEHFIST